MYLVQNACMQGVSVGPLDKQQSVTLTKYIQEICSCSYPNCTQLLNIRL